MVPFENGKLWLHCSRLDVDTRPKDKSATAFWPVRAELLRRYGREQIKWALGISGNARLGTTLCQLWTNGKFASGFMTHSEVTNTQRWPEQQTPRPGHQALQLAIIIECGWAPPVLEAQLLEKLDFLWRRLSA
jgi:hypothetical protein